MEFNELWIPVIAEGIKWVKEKLSTSKKDLKLKVADLETQVKMLSYGNATLIKSMEQIITEILQELKRNGEYTIEADTIILVKDNQGQLSIGNNSQQHINVDSLSSMFDDVDEEIAQSRLLRPSERGNNHENT